MGESTSQWLFRWLGRQVGHVKTAVKHDPTKPVPPKLEAEKPKPAQASGPKPQAGQPSGAKPESKDGVVYRTDKVEEVPHPTDPNLKLRRTVIDEVIVEKKKES